MKESLDFHILWNIRLPRLLVALACGAACSGGGVLCQGIFRNSLASPTTLGIAAGGTLAASVALYLAPGQSSLFAVPLAAGLGVLGTTLALLILWRPLRATASLEHLLLVGLAFNALCGALTSFVVALASYDPSLGPRIMSWLFGSLNARSWEHVGMAVVILPFLVWGWRLTRSLDVLTLGEDVAQSLGVNLRQTQYAFIAIMAGLIGISVAAAGALPFLGLIVPHVSRLILGPKHRPLYVFAIANGMSMLLLADLGARTLMSPEEIDVGILIALIGAPVFLWQLLHTARQGRGKT